MLRRPYATGPGRENGGLQAAAATADAISRPSPRLDPRVQGRRTGVLELQRRWPVRGVDAAWRDRDEVRGQARLGRRQEALHEQQRGQPLPQTEVPQRLEVRRLSERGGEQIPAPQRI